METKYYQPLITEFKPTFRYEKADSILFGENKGEKDWTKHVYSTQTDSLTIQTIDGLLANGDVRVKELCHDDIIEAEWKKSFNSDIAEFYSKYNDFSLKIVAEHKGLWCLIMKLDEELPMKLRFNGTIRNYNELLDVMQMLNIKVK